MTRNPLEIILVTEIILWYTAHEIIIWMRNICTHKLYISTPRLWKYDNILMKTNEMLMKYNETQLMRLLFGWEIFAHTSYISLPLGCGNMTIFSWKLMRCSWNTAHEIIICSSVTRIFPNNNELLKKDW